MDIVRNLEMRLSTVSLKEEVEDRWVWEGDKNSSYSTKEGYRILNKKEEIFSVNRWANFIWNKWAPLKVNTFIWKVLQDRIPSKVNLEERNFYE